MVSRNLVYTKYFNSIYRLSKRKKKMTPPQFQLKSNNLGLGNAAMIGSSNQAMNNYWQTYGGYSGGMNNSIFTGNQSTNNAISKAEKQMEKAAKTQNILTWITGLGSAIMTALGITKMIKTIKGGSDSSGASKSKEMSDAQINDIVSNANQGDEKSVQRAIQQLRTQETAAKGQEKAQKDVYTQADAAAKTKGKDATELEGKATELNQQAASAKGDYEIAKGKTTTAKSAWDACPATIKDAQGNETPNPEKSRLEGEYKKAVEAEESAKQKYEALDKEAKETDAQAKATRKEATELQLTADTEKTKLTEIENKVNNITEAIKSLESKEGALEARDKADGNFATRLFNKDQRQAHKQELSTTNVTEINPEGSDLKYKKYTF